MPICLCCSKHLSKRQWYNHKKYGPPRVKQLGQFASGLRTEEYQPIPPRKKRLERDKSLNGNASEYSKIEMDSVANNMKEPAQHEEGPVLIYAPEVEDMVEEKMMEIHNEKTIPPMSPILDAQLEDTYSITSSASTSAPSDTLEGGSLEDIIERNNTNSPLNDPHIYSEFDEDEESFQECMESLDDELNTETPESLTQNQKNAVVMFGLFLEGRVSRATLNLFLQHFGKQLGLTTQYHINQEIKRLAKLRVDKYDCCINSCVAFTGLLADEDKCPKCNHERFKAGGKPYRQYTYIPLIPRIQIYFQSPSIIQLLKYHTTRTQEPNSSSDIFDGSHFKDLSNEHVTIQNIPMTYKYFECEEDIPFGLMGDGVRLFKRSQKTIWPFILINYGFSPEIRTHLTHILPLLLVPGPHQPKDHNSFLFPFHKEMLELAHGVPTFHHVKQTDFLLRAYLITNVADLQGFKANQYIKGPNGFSPCRTCRLQGCRDPTSSSKVYYYPLRPPRTGAVALDRERPPVTWDPWNLPLRTHLSYKESLVWIQSAPNKKEKERRSKTQGVTGESILVNLPGFDRARSVPHDFMHLIFENIIQTLVALWTGTMKFVDPENVDDEPYLIPKNIWELIGKETEASMKTIPAYFVRSLPNIATNPGLFIAETWAFWFQYLAPYLLQDRLPNPYYRHMVDLVDIIQQCLQFTIENSAIDELEQKIISWVVQYEKLYYQYKAERLPVYTSCIHALLHVPYDIRQNGPSWVYWVFVMEHFCGHLVSQIKSRRYPYEQLANRIVFRSELSHIALKYAMFDELNSPAPASENELSSCEKIYPEYPLTILRSPCNDYFQVDLQTRRKIAMHLTAQFGQGSDSNTILSLLPERMESWAKVRIQDGDFIRTKQTVTNVDGRDQSFVRYDLLVDTKAHQRHKPPEFKTQCFYGQLERILVCRLPPHSAFGQTPLIRIFGIVKECHTNGHDATHQLVTYTTMSTTTTVIELTTISCAIGRIRIGSGNRWGIIDRSKDLARTIFVDTETN